MVPRPIGLGSPQCARCGKSVFMAEQVIGPFSRPYHKSCLTCTVCNKRLDSTLLVEHEGDPYCKNCHKAHLGQGKGGFGLSVPLRPDKPSALKGKAMQNGGLASPSAGAQRVEDRLNEELSGISISRRQDNRSPVQRGPASPPLPTTSYQSPNTRLMNTSRPTTVAQSIDDLIASGVDVPIPFARNDNGSAASKKIEEAMYGGSGREGEYTRRSYSPHKEEDVQRSYSPIKEEAQRLTFDHHDELLKDRQHEQQATVDEYTEPVYAATGRRAESPVRKPAVPAFDETPSTPVRERETIGTIRGITGHDGLPAPQRKDPITLARERERGLNYDGAGTAKTYSPRTTPVSPNHLGPGGSRPFGNGGDVDSYAYSPNSALSKMGLGSTVSAAAVGTPLCARCERPVYFAEQKQAASRKWHRGCLRCDGCSTTLESGKLEEGPLSAAYEFPTNIWCRTCYAKRFGPKGIGVAGMSLPETMKR